jgi:hypothetical protein
MEVDELKWLTSQERMLLSSVRTRGFVHHLDAFSGRNGQIKLRCHRYGFDVPAAELASIARAEQNRPLLEVHLCIGNLATPEERQKAITQVNRGYLQIRPKIFVDAFDWFFQNNARFTEMQPAAHSAYEILEKYTTKVGSDLILQGCLVVDEEPQAPPADPTVEGGRASLLASNATLHEGAESIAAGGRRAYQGSGGLHQTWDQTELEVMYPVRSSGLYSSAISFLF